MNKKSLVAIALLAVSAISSAQSVYPGQHQGKMKKETVAPVRVESFDLKDVRLLPSRFRDNMLRDSAWMTSIDVSRLLHSFRTNAGVFAGREGGYMTVKKLGGWESLDCELRGHTTGHLLSAYALMYAATGSEIFKLKGDSLVNGLTEVQNALKGGYLSAFPEELINRNIRGKSVWAPWYTLHKLYSGLIDQYLYADNQQALKTVTKMGDWAYNKLKPLSEETRKLMIRNEFGGVNESFYNLYAITGDERYRWLAEYFYHNDVIDPLKELRDDLGTKHTNTFIPKVIAEARNYELTENETSKKLSEFFWHTMIDHHTFAPGCSSDKEHFFDPKKFSKHLTGYTGETCCTYNMLKLSRHLFCWTGDSSIADYYERALYNHILGQQDPETGMVTYFLPLLSGSHKLYSTKENSFWCCVGSGFENHAKYGEAIYYHNNQGIYVNLFIPSQVTSSSQTEDYQFTHAEDLVTLMDSLHIKKAHIVGLSLGGFITADMLAYFPDRMLSAFLASGNIRKSKGPSEPMTPEEARVRDKEIAALKEKGVDVMKKEWFEGLMKSGGSQRERMRDSLWQMIDEWDAWQPLHKEVRVVAGLDAIEKLKKNHPDVPALIVEGHSSGNRFSKEPPILQYLPNGKLKVIDDCGHMLNMERPEEFNAALEEFLKNVQ